MYLTVTAPFHYSHLQRRNPLNAVIFISTSYSTTYATRLIPLPYNKLASLDFGSGFFCHTYIYEDKAGLPENPLFAIHSDVFGFFWVIFWGYSSWLRWKIPFCFDIFLPDEAVSVHDDVIIFGDVQLVVDDIPGS